MRGKERKNPANALLSDGALIRLLTWLSAAYPIGAFSYSSGIEWAVEAGDIADAESLRRWIEAMLVDGPGGSDGILFAHGHRAASGHDGAALAALAELGAAFAPTAERYQETINLGRAFLDVTRAAWPCAALTDIDACWQGPIVYPLAVAIACAGHGIALAPALQAFLASLCTNWISAGVRLVPLGHTDGQRVLAALEPAIAATAAWALDAPLDDLGGATFRADLASARHESQYTRLFRS